MNQSSKHFWITSIYTLLLSIFLLQPFNFDIPDLEKNDIKWISGTNGIEFMSNGIIRSSSLPSKLYDALVSGTGLSLELWITTKSLAQGGPARIISYSYDKLIRNFTLGQHIDALVVRLRTTSTDLNGKNPEMYVKDVFSSFKPQHIVVTYNCSTEAIYINGKKKVETAELDGGFSNWNPSYPLVIGNESTGNRPWSGRLFLVAIYDRALTEEEIWKNYTAGKVFDSTTALPNSRVTHGLVSLYLFTEGGGDRVFDRSGRPPPMNLKIPATLQVTERIRMLLSSPYREFVPKFLTFKQLADLIGNIIIFVPIGFFFHSVINQRYRSSLTIIFIFILCLLFTFSIEILQYFLEARYSSMTDIINNMIGVTLGIIIGKSHILYRIK